MKETCLNKYILFLKIYLINTIVILEKVRKFLVRNNDFQRSWKNEKMQLIKVRFSVLY